MLKKSAGANPHGLLGGLFSPTEAAVNPPKAVRGIPAWLTAKFDVRFEFGTTVGAMDVTDVGNIATRSTDGRHWQFDRVIVCGGADFATLFPDVLAGSGLKHCKLQMLKTRSQPEGWRCGPHLASGLTLRHYRNFDICSSLSAVKHRIAAESPELDRYGIHVMASQNDEGCMILGDSHEYGEAIEPFDKAIIDDLLLRELRSVFALPDWTIAERWHGIYVKASH